MISEVEAKNIVSNLTYVSRETMARLEKFNELLLRWTAKINLISKSQTKTTWSRHILDSAQVWSVRPKIHKTWIDIGTGGGFPGMVLAIIAKGEGDATEFHFVESDARKCAFLRNACRELDLSAEVHTTRIESFTGVSADVVSARALASVDQLLGYSVDFLGADGVCIFLKGSSYGTEIKSAKESWRFDHEVNQSLTSDDGVLLTIKDISCAK
jgi:16S rRNA (guanine527-N7)-methyltransferase